MLEDGKYVVRQDRAKVVREIFSDAGAGVGIFTIVRRLNARRVPTFGSSKGWTNSYVAKVLRSRAVIGDFTPHRVIDGKRAPEGEPILKYFPNVVDDKTFNRVQEGLKQRRHRSSGRKGKFISNLFTGIVRCAYCQSPVRYESKGGKGKDMLVCNAARCGFGCGVTRRWSYGAFESSVIAFVREVDLEHIVNDEDEARRRAELEQKITALRGEDATLERKVELILELVGSAGGSADVVRRKLKELDERRTTVKIELVEKEKEFTKLASAATGFYEDQEQLKVLIGRLQGRGDAEQVYRLRSMIAERLRSTVSTILLAPLGDVPNVRKTIEHIRNEPGSEDVVAHLERNAITSRYFIAAFKIGDTRARVVCPGKDPLRFEFQFLGTSIEMLGTKFGMVERIEPDRN
jgi:hypothetical protein